jgi:hypothetical protein
MALTFVDWFGRWQTGKADGSWRPLTTQRCGSGNRGGDDGAQRGATVRLSPTPADDAWAYHEFHTYPTSQNRCQYQAWSVGVSEGGTSVRGRCAHLARMQMRAVDALSHRGPQTTHGLRNRAEGHPPCQLTAWRVAVRRQRVLEGGRGGVEGGVRRPSRRCRWTRFGTQHRGQSSIYAQGQRGRERVSSPQQMGTGGHSTPRVEGEEVGKGRRSWRR